MRVADICNRDVVTLAAEASLREAARAMREHHVGDVVIVDARGPEQKPLGILTDRDIVVEVLARNVDLDSVAIGDTMSFELLSICDDQSIDEAIELMRSKAVRRAPVVDVKGALVGIVSVDDLIGLVARNLAQIYALLVRGRERESTLRE